MLGWWASSKGGHDWDDNDAGNRQHGRDGGDTGGWSMVGVLKKFWHFLALLAGLGLIAFEVLKPGGVTGDSLFWLFVGGLIVILSVVEIAQRRAAKQGGEPADERAADDADGAR